MPPPPKKNNTCIYKHLSVQAGQLENRLVEINSKSNIKNVKFNSKVNVKSKEP